jgi:predicted transposase YdaD
MKKEKEMKELKVAREEGRQEGRVEGREEGRQEGIVIGEKRGEVKLLVDLILYKFGGISREEVSSMIEKLNLNADQILILGRKILEVKSLEELLGSQPHELHETAVRKSPRKRTRREIVAM